MALQWKPLKSVGALDLGMMTEYDLDRKLFGAVAGPNVMVIWIMLAGQYGITTLSFPSQIEAERWLSQNTA